MALHVAVVGGDIRVCVVVIAVSTVGDIVLSAILNEGSVIGNCAVVGILVLGVDGLLRAELLVLDHAVVVAHVSHFGLNRARVYRQMLQIVLFVFRLSLVMLLQLSIEFGVQIRHLHLLLITVLLGTSLAVFGSGTASYVVRGMFLRLTAVQLAIRMRLLSR